MQCPAPQANSPSGKQRLLLILVPQKCQIANMVLAGDMWHGSADGKEPLTGLHVHGKHQLEGYMHALASNSGLLTTSKQAETVKPVWVTLMACIASNCAPPAVVLA